MAIRISEYHPNYPNPGLGAFGYNSLYPDRLTGMKKEIDITLNQIPEKAKEVAHNLKGGEIFALVGPLGSGKTTFVQALGKELKIRQKITSPTFILLQAFPFKLNPVKSLPRRHVGAADALRRPTSNGVKAKKEFWLYHLDLYRTKNFKEVKALGLLEVWGRPDTVTLIEWADKIKTYLPGKSKIIKFLN
jgi:tRNA threonylcarbamoyladenosine biosynthesis protein TsaE